MTPSVANRLALTSAIASVLLVCALATGNLRCGEKPAPQAAPVIEEVAARCPEADGLADARQDRDREREEELNKVRQAARDYLRGVSPDLKTDGVFTLPFRPGSLYVAGVDTIGDGGRRRTVDLLVRRYVRKNGGAYWRAESLGAEQAAEFTRRSPEHAE